MPILVQYASNSRSKAQGSCLTLMDTNRGRRAEETSEYSMFQNEPTPEDADCVMVDDESTSADDCSGVEVEMEGSVEEVESGMAGEKRGMAGG